MMLKSVEQVIEAVGGAKAAASLARVSLQAVSNWKSRGRIPADLMPLFALRGVRAKPSVFGARVIDKDAR